MTIAGSKFWRDENTLLRIIRDPSHQADIRDTEVLHHYVDDILNAGSNNFCLSSLPEDRNL